LIPEVKRQVTKRTICDFKKREDRQTKKSDGSLCTAECRCSCVPKNEIFVVNAFRSQSLTEIQSHI